MTVIARSIRWAFGAVFIFGLCLGWVLASNASAEDTTDEAAIRKVMTDFQKAYVAGDVDALKGGLEFPDDKDGKELAGFLEKVRQSEALTESMEGFKKLNVASMKAFGKPWVPGTPTAPKATTRMAEVKPAYEVTVNGDHATVKTSIELPEGKKLSVSRNFVRRAGAWKMVVDFLPPSATQPGPSSDMNLGMAEACAATIKEIEGGTYKTIEDARQGLLDNLGKIRGRLAKSRPQPPTKRLVWDLSKSRTLRDVEWPKEKTGGVWIPEKSEDLYQLTLAVPGLKPIVVLTEHPVVAREYKKELDLGDPVVRIEFGNKNPMTAAEVRAFAENIGLGEALRKKLAEWPPAEPGNQTFSFRQRLEGGGGIRMDLLSYRKFTGEKDSWGMSLQVDWGKKPAAYWEFD